MSYRVSWPTTKPGPRCGRKCRRVMKSLRVPQLVPHILAALAPDDISTTVVDEELRPIDYSLSFDLVGITCTTPTAKRSYELADRYRTRGSKVILGGCILPSCLKKPYGTPMPPSSVRLEVAGQTWSATSRTGTFTDSTRPQFRTLQRVPCPKGICLLTRRYSIA
jgi:hypothetical protein